MSSDKTGIEWTDATWNPTTGCDRVSPGCDHCYALTQANRLKAMGSARYQRDGDPETSGPGFGLTMHPDALDQPLRWKKPRRIFVNSMSDLFHKDVTDEFIAQVWAVMAMSPQHTFQILTKRHGRMRSLLNRPDFERTVLDAMVGSRWTPLPNGGWEWPLPNVWLGVSVEDQNWADIRVPALADTPAAVRFLSAEPLLGLIDLTGTRRSGKVLLGHGESCSCLGCHNVRTGSVSEPAWWGRNPIDWLIVGGESGAGARPMHPAWARSLPRPGRRVAFLFKQWGQWAPVAAGDELPTDRWVLGNGAVHDSPWSPEQRAAEPGRWHVDVDVVMRRVGRKHMAGRELDGRTWDEYPKLAVERTTS